MKSPNSAYPVLAVLFALALLPVYGCADAGAPVTDVAPMPPNVIVILADDLGYADLGSTGCKDFPTPNIDRLAASGVRFTDGHVAGNVCAPSRVALLTGAVQNRTGFTLNGDSLAPETRLVTRDFHDAGYETVAIGKWHLGPDPRTFGFDHFTGFLGGSRSYFPKKDIPSDGRVMRDGADIEMSGWKYTTGLFTDEALRLIRGRDPLKPFFLYLAYNAPHTPMQPPAELKDKFSGIRDKGRRAYAGMVTALDDGVGRILDYLDANSLRKNTMVVFLSDNGGATNNSSDNGSWRGMKGSYWEGGHRVPFIISWPGKLKSGEYAPPINSVDLAPTFLSLSGHAPKRTDGVNLLPYLSGEKSGSPHDTFCWHTGPSEAVRSGDLMLIRTYEEDGSVHGVTLFDLSKDPGQTVNLAKTHPAERARLIAFLDQWNAEMPPPTGVMEPVYRENYRRKHEMSVVGREAERKLP